MISGADFIATLLDLTLLAPHVTLAGFHPSSFGLIHGQSGRTDGCGSWLTV